MTDPKPDDAKEQRHERFMKECERITKIALENNEKPSKVSDERLKSPGNFNS